MVVRLRLAIEQEEYSALLKLALTEERNPEGQLRYILRRELERQGLISTNRDVLASGTIAQRSSLEGRHD
jgi:hypothetical protein